MKVIGIGGLGADGRVFEKLKLNFEIQTINWIEPNHKSDLHSYVKLLSKQIKHQEDLIVIGVSFGGIVAIELSKVLNVKMLVLISSVANYKELPKLWIRIGKTGIINSIPNKLLKPPQLIFNYFFSAKNKDLLKRIIDETSLDFLRWALKQIVNWKGELNSNNVLRIHGSKDRLIPLIGESIEIRGGGHFMIVDRAEEISRILNDKIKHVV